MIGEIFILIILIALNAFFASSEIALISLNDNKVRKMAEEGHKKAQLIHNLTSEPSRFLATIQIGITLAGFLASAFASETFADRLVSLAGSLGVPVPASVIKVISVTIITIILSYFTLVMGELVPKRLAMQKPEQIAMFAVGPLSVLAKLSSPFVRFLTLSTNFFIRLMGGNPDANEEEITEEEIRMMVDVGEEKGVIQETEKEMINNIFEFDNTRVSEIMTHRTDIIALSLDSPLEDALELVSSEKFSRVPIYEESIDNIVGILSVKDLFHYLKSNHQEPFSLSAIIRRPYFIPESKMTDELFREMKKNKVHMAVAIDEYGGTAGIVTMEDLLEEIVGNIFDEYDDDEEKEVEKIDDNTYLFDGSTSLDNVAEHLEVDLPIEEYDTLSGFLMGQLGRIPDKGENPQIEFDDVVFKVEKVEEKRISKVKACRA